MSLSNNIYKLRLKDLSIRNKVVSKFINKDKKVYIVSSKKYQNRIKEDLCLQKCFLENKTYCEIVAWEDNKSTNINIIRTVWGYHKDSDNFINYIKNINTINDNNIIIDNIDKKKQYELLRKNDINTIHTEFMNDISSIKKIDEKIVVKPIISASGNNTYIINDKEDLSKLEGISNIMIQPYIEGIKDGEISIIVINKEIKYGIKRYPGIFTDYKKEEYIEINKIPEELIKEVNKIININEYNDVKIMRVDSVNDKNVFKVMEVELVDPALYIETIPDKNYRKKIYQDIVDITLNVF